MRSPFHCRVNGSSSLRVGVISNRRAVISRHEERQGSDGLKVIPCKNDWYASWRSGDKVIIRRDTLAQQATMKERLDPH
jgi:hypothetical protein